MGWWINSIERLLKGQKEIMDVLADQKTALAKLQKAVADVAAAIKALAATAANGISAADAEQFVADVNAQADALEAAVTPSPVA